MGRQEFATVDVVRLEVEADPAGLVNLMQNPSGELGGWAWITSIAGSKVVSASVLSDTYPALYPSTYSGDSLPASDTALRYFGVAGASWFTTEDMPVAGGQYAAARWNALSGTTGFFRARFEWVDSAGAVISSSAQTGYLAHNSGVGNLGAQLAPAGAVWCRLRFDLFSTNTGTNHAGAHTWDFAEVTGAEATASATLGQSRSNLVPNPSFEADASGWFAAGDSAVVRSTTQAYVGSASLRYTHGASTAGGAFWTLEGRRGIPVTGNATYAVSFASKAASTGRTWRAYPQWYSAAGAYLGSGAPVSVTNTTSGWTVGSGTALAPASAAFLALDVEVTAVAGEQHYFDAFLVEQAASAGAYFDASTPDAGGWDYGGTTQLPLVARTRTNLIPNPIPASTTGYAAGSGAAVEIVGGSGLRVLAAGDFGSFTNDTYASVGGDSGALQLGMQPGKTYTVSADLVGQNHGRTDGYPGRENAVVAFWRVGSGPYQEAASPSGQTVSPGRKSVTFTLPSGATEAFIRLYNGSWGGIPASTYTEWKQVLLEEASSPEAYFDGGTPDGTSDFAVIDRAWTGTANNSTSTETETITLPYATAVNSNLGYLDPVQYLNVIGESHELREVRQALQVGELTATIVSRALDPADSSLIRPGRRARLRALVNGAWDELITGKLLKANVDYELKDPSVPDDKRAIITVNLVDAGQPLSQAKRPQGVSTIDELPFVLEGAGVPWSVNGSGNQVATAIPTTFNENASALNQVALTRDTRSGYAWVARRGVVNVWDAASLPAGSPIVLDEATYSDLKVTYGTDDCINAVSFTVQTLGVDGTTTETTYGPYEDADSIATYGRFLKEFTVTGLTKPEVDALAAAVLAANKTPARRVQSVTLPINTQARLDAHALIDLYDEVQVVNGEVSLSDTLRVTGIEHSIQLKKWLVTLTFATDGAVASPLFQPPVQSDASPDVGVIEWFAGPTSKIPSTKLLCDGSSKAVASYPYLFAVIGYMFGGSGAFFNVPNLVDRFPIGAGTKALGTIGGSPTKTISINEMPSHQHAQGVDNTYNVGSSAPIGGRYAMNNTGANISPVPVLTTAAGNGQPLDVMNPWLALTPVIRAV